MPVKIKCAPHGSKPLANSNAAGLRPHDEDEDAAAASLSHMEYFPSENQKPKEVANAEDLYNASSLDIRESNPPGDYQASSYEEAFDGGLGLTIHSASNGFLHSCIKAYCEHLHLVIRPDDVWLAILTQLNRYLNRNGEALRELFVSHEGRKELEMMTYQKDESEKGDLDWRHFACDMADEMEDHIVDPQLAEWVIPIFSTTTDHDEMVASIVFMGAMRKHIDYGARTGCGIPSVTLKYTPWEHRPIVAETVAEGPRKTG